MSSEILCIQVNGQGEKNVTVGNKNFPISESIPIFKQVHLRLGIIYLIRRYGALPTFTELIPNSQIESDHFVLMMSDEPNEFVLRDQSGRLLVKMHLELDVLISQLLLTLSRLSSVNPKLQDIVLCLAHLVDSPP